MRCKVTVIGDDSLTVDVADVVRGWEDARGSEVVVLADGVDVRDAARLAASRTPAAVIVVATDDPERDCAVALESSLLPRGRVVGLPPGEDPAPILEAMVLGRPLPTQLAVHCRGELGIEDRVATVPVTVGRRGVTAIGG